MRKHNKVIAIILLLLMMLTFFAVIVYCQEVANLPFQFIDLASYPLIGYYFPTILFWLSVAFFASSLIAMFIIIFYPKEQVEVKLKEDHGVLTIDKKAIRGFVRSSIEEADFLAPPKIKVNMTKHKIKIKIKGDLKRTSDLYEKNDVLVHNIQRNLKQLIGVNQQVAINVTYQGYKEPESHTARVI